MLMGTSRIQVKMNSDEFIDLIIGTVVAVIVLGIIYATHITQ